MNKEEKIKEAYEKYFDKIKYAVDSNGWILMSISITREIDIEFEKKLKIHENNNSGLPTICVRPKSIQGIENNNGWIKIESEDDLPKIGGYDMSSFKLLYWTNLGLFHSEYYQASKTVKITHYMLQPIQKPKPPIY